jgi:putative transposase
MKKRTTRTYYPPEQKAQIVLEVLSENQTLAQIATAHGVHVNMLRKWKAQAVDRLPSVFSDENQAVRDLEAAQEHERQELYAEIGRPR